MGKHNHDTSKLVAKHLKALFEEAVQTDACEICIMDNIMSACIGTVLMNSKDLDVTKGFVQEAFAEAIAAQVEGRANVHDLDKARKDKLN